MKVYPEEPTGVLTEGLKRTLEQFRARRAFDPRRWCEAKCALLNEYLSRSKLSACVVALSGGIDSALVLALAHRAAQQKNSPIRRIVPVSLPVHTEGAATGQDAATQRAQALSERLGLECLVVDVSAAHQAIKQAVDGALGCAGANWASGQLAATVRTPAYYYITSVLSEQGTPALVLGTTNRDEGAYLGYVGKASDAVVDLQLIADLHKSEVYAAAKFLGVTEDILSVAPAGDMYDGRTDVEVFGASYDALELYLSMLESGREAELIAASWDESSTGQYAKIAHNLEALHRYNAHKYISGWPGVFLNILPSSIPGGWQMLPATSATIEKPADVDNLNGMVDLGVSLDDPGPFAPKLEIKQVLRNSATGLRAERVRGLLTSAEVRRFLAALSPHAGFPVGISGYEREYRAGDPIGSYRLRAYDEALAGALWRRLKPVLPCCEVTPEGARADSQEVLVWRPVGVSALFRFIRYESDGVLVAHYDSPYLVSDDLMTLKSLVIYLTDAPEEGGETRFLTDAQDLLDVRKRNYADWPRAGRADEVIAQVSPRAGEALLFYHRLLHDGAALPLGASKLIIRTDILYQAVRPACASAFQH